MTYVCGNYARLNYSLTLHSPYTHTHTHTHTYCNLPFPKQSITFFSLLGIIHSLLIHTLSQFPYLLTAAGALVAEDAKSWSTLRCSSSTCLSAFSRAALCVFNEAYPHKTGWNVCGAMDRHEYVEVQNGGERDSE